MDLIAGWRFALQRLRAGWRFMAVAAVGVVVAATLLALAPIYAASMSDLGLRHRLDRGLENPFDRIASVEVDRLLLEDPVDRARRDAIVAMTEARVGWLGVDGEVLVEERSGRLDVSFVGHEDEAPERPVEVPERGTEPVRQPWGGFVFHLSGLEDHVEVVEGRLPSDSAAGLEVVLLDGFQKHAAVGDVIRLDDSGLNNCPPVPSSMDPTVARDEVRCRPSISVKASAFATVIGFVRRADPDAWRWEMYAGRWEIPDVPIQPRIDNVEPDSPVLGLVFAGYGQMPLFTTRGQFFDRFAHALPESTGRHWAGVIVDTGRVGIGDVDRAIADLRTWRPEISERLDLLVPARLVPLQVLERYQNAQSFSAIPLLLILLQVVGIVVYYVVMVMAMLLDRQAEEIGVYRSRGANSLQLVGFSFIEGLVLAIPAALVGPWIAAWVVANLGRTPTFEPMTGGLALPVVVSAEAYLLAVAGAAVALLAVLLPAMIVTRRGIVDVKREESRPGERNLIQRYYLDFAMVGLAALLLWQLERRGSVFDPGTVGGWSSDPLLLLSPFVVTLAVAGMLLRFYPPVVRLGVRALLAFKGTAIAIGLRRTGRAPAAYARLMLLLVMAVSVGTFAASYGPTVERSLAERERYAAGVSLRASLRNVEDIRAASADGVRAIAGVRDAVLVHRGEIKAPNGTVLPLLAIDPASAERMLYWREDFSEREFLEVMRLLQSRIPAGGGLDIPPDATRIAVRVKSNQLGRSFLRARFRDANGVYLNATLELREDFGDGWEVATARIPLNPPVSLVAIISSDSLGQNLREAGTLTIDHITAIVPGRESTVIENFEGGFHWTMYSTRPDDETFERVQGRESAYLGGGAAVFTWERSITPQRRVFALIDPAVPVATVVDPVATGVLGAGVGGGATLTFGPVQVPVQLRAAADYFPTLIPGSGFVVMNIEHLRSVAGTVEFEDAMHPNEVWIDFDPSLSLSQQLDIVAALQYPATTPLLIASPILHRDARLDAVAADPTLRASGAGILLVAFVAVLGLSTLGFVVALVTGANQRTTEFAVLRAVGSSGREILRSLVLEWGAVLVLGGVLGVLLGRQVARIMLSFLEVTEDGGRVVPPFVLLTDWRTLGIGVAVLAAVVGTTLAFAWLASMRRATAAQLRLTR